MIKFNNTEFGSKSELIAHIVKNRDDIIELKKSQTKLANPTSMPIPSEKTEEKAEGGGFNGKVTVIGNTYLFMDSHKDVHAKGCFKRTISNNLKNIFHLTDHEYKITSKVGQPTKIYEQEVKWSDLGVSKEGYTEALYMDSTLKMDWHPRIFKAYANGEIDQHSVGMQYVKLELAVDSDDKDYKKENKLWKEYYPQLGNPEEADKYGFFFVVKEAKLREISSVLLGSNTKTPTISAKTDPSADTQAGDSSQDTQQKTLAELMNNFNI